MTEKRGVYTDGMEQVTETLIESFRNIANGMLASLIYGAGIGAAAALVVFLLLRILSRLAKPIKGKIILKICGTIFLIVTMISLVMIYIKVIGPKMIQ